MTNEDIEKYAVNKIKDLILCTQGLSSQINDNDKEPIYDGYINVYNKNKPSLNFLNDELLGKVDVQVKGQRNKGEFKDKISFRVNRNYIKMFGSGGGAIFFVVQINPVTKDHCIYYKELKPVEAATLFRSLKPQQQSKNLQFYKFSKNHDEIYHILLNFLEHSKMQTSFADTDLKNIDYYQNEGLLESIEFKSFGSFKGKEFIYEDNLDAYFKIKGLNTLIPSPVKVSNIKFLQQVAVDVSINNKKYYSSINIQESNDYIELHFGKSFIYKQSKSVEKQSSVTFKNARFSSDLLIDTQFLIDLYKFRTINLVNHGESRDFPDEVFSSIDINNLTKDLALYNEINELCKVLDINEDLDMNQLNAQDQVYLNLLLDSFVRGKNIVQDVKLPLGLVNIKISNLNILIFVTKAENDNTYAIHNYHNKDLSVYTKDDDELILISRFVMLNRDNILQCSNLSMSKLSDSIISIPPTKLYLTLVNQLLLEIIFAYDKSSDEAMLKSAKFISEWLIEVNDDSDIFQKHINFLNYLQIIKRERSLNYKEIVKLSKIIDLKDNPISHQLGAYILLEDHISVKRLLTNLEEDELNNFKEFPIYSLYINDLKKGKKCIYTQTT